MVDNMGRRYTAATLQTPAAVKANKIKKSSFKSNEKIHKKVDGSYCVVSASKASSVIR